MTMGLCMCVNVYGVVCMTVYGYICDCMGFYMCVYGVVYEVVHVCDSVYEVVYVCPHAPVRHLNSVSQSPVPPRVDNQA